MKIEDWVKWMRERPDRKARQRRLFSALDLAMPDWEEFVVRPQFKMWANRRNPFTRKTRLDILRSLSLDNYDGLNTARLLKVGRREINALQNIGTSESIRDGSVEHGIIIDKRYEIMQPLGEGGCGAVAMVFSHEVEEFFAMKMIRSEYLADAGSRTRFLREANLWVDIGNHENIVHAELVDKIGDELVILMELIDPDVRGRVSLQDHISQEVNFSTKQITEWAIGICRGMAHAHLNGMHAHRDLKPDNILITTAGAAKVTDFGISSLHQNPLVRIDKVSNIAGEGCVVAETANHVILGTLPYMPPEQFVNAHGCDERSDIYSFGVVLYQLISQGRWPYGNIQSLVRGIHPDDLARHFFLLHSERKPNEQSHKLYALAEACLHKKPGARPASFQVLERMLHEAIGQVVVTEELESKTDYFDPWETGRKAASLLRLERYEEALALFDEILEKFPIGLQWEFEKALTLSRMGRNDESFALYTKILERNPTELRVLINKGLLCQASGDLDEAERLYSTALKHHPNDSSALINMGNLAYKQGRYEQARMYYGKAVELDPKEATGWYNMALACKADAMVDLSNNCFTQFLECSDPLDPRREYALKTLNECAE